MVSLDDDLLSPCPKCQGPTRFHCEDDECQLLRCIDCRWWGHERASNWLPPSKWDQAG